MLDRQSLQDFEMRILFQMNGNDSSSLMDSPEASRLGVHRAILYDEGQGLVEKFRPYGLPSNEYPRLGQKALVRTDPGQVRAADFSPPEPSDCCIYYDFRSSTEASFSGAPQRGQ